MPAVPGLLAMALALLPAAGPAEAGFAAMVSASAPPSPAVRSAPPARRALAQATPAEPRIMTFAWTLYPRMWAEIDLRMAAGAEAVAEITVEGGEVTWNLHTHPPDAPADAFVAIETGRTARRTIRWAPSEPGWYSYLFGNDTGTQSVRLRVVLHLSGEVRLQAVRP